MSNAGAFIGRPNPPFLPSHRSIGGLVIISAGTGLRELLSHSILSTAAMGNRCNLSDGKTLCRDSHSTSEKAQEREEEMREEKKPGRLKSASVSHPNWTLNTHCTVNTARDTEGRCFIVGQIRACRLHGQAPLTQTASSRKTTDGRNSPHPLICSSTAMQTHKTTQNQK